MKDDFPLPIKIWFLLLASWTLALAFFSFQIFNTPAPVERQDSSSGRGRVSSAQDMLALINNVRQEANLEPLRENAALQASAYDKACDMVNRNYYGHLDPDGQESWYLMKRHGYQAAFAGENLIEGFANDDEAFQALMDSPKHRSNIMSDQYRDVGIGRCGSYTVQHFGMRKL